MSLKSVARRNSSPTPARTAQVATPQKALTPQIQAANPKKTHAPRQRAQSTDGFGNVPQQQAKEKAAQNRDPLANVATAERGTRKAGARPSRAQQLNSLRSKKGKTGADAAEPQQGSKLALRPMQDKFATERHAPDRQAKVIGKEITVKDKPWDPAQATHYMNPQEKAAHRTDFQPGPDGRTTLKSQQSQVDKANAALVAADAGQQNAPLVRRGKRELPAATKPDANAVQAPVGKQIEGDRRILAMDKNAEVYTSQPKTYTDQDKFSNINTHHSSFNNGKPLAFAGEAVVRKDDTLKGLTDRSGHYQPTAKETVQGLDTLEKRRGVNLDNVQFDMVRGRPGVADQVTHGMAREHLQGQGSESLFKARHQVADEIVARGKPKTSLELNQGVARTSLKNQLEPVAPQNIRDSSAPSLPDRNEYNQSKGVRESLPRARLQVADELKTGGQSGSLKANLKPVSPDLIRDNSAPVLPGNTPQIQKQPAATLPSAPHPAVTALRTATPQKLTYVPLGKIDNRSAPEVQGRTLSPQEHQALRVQAQRQMEDHARLMATGDGY